MCFSWFHLKILRNGSERDVSIRLGELPAEGASNEGNGTSQSSPLHGVGVNDLTPSVARDLGLSPRVRGSVVTDVADGTPAADTGLKRDDVIEEANHHPVTTVAEYERVVREAGKRQLVLLVNRSGQTSFLVVEPE